MIRTRSAIMITLWGLCASGAGTTLLAQTLPGQPRPEDRWEMERARYRALILEKVNVTITAWQKAWSEDDLARMAEAYTEEAVLVLADTAWTGREQIREGLREFLPSVGSLSHSLSVFEAGGSVAMIMGSFLYRVETAPGSRTPVAGFCMTVLVEENGNWRIRSQLFRPTESSGPGGALCSFLKAELCRLERGPHGASGSSRGVSRLLPSEAVTERHHLMGPVPPPSSSPENPPPRVSQPM